MRTASRLWGLAEHGGEEGCVLGDHLRGRFHAPRPNEGVKNRSIPVSSGKHRGSGDGGHEVESLDIRHGTVVLIGSCGEWGESEFAEVV